MAKNSQSKAGVDLKKERGLHLLELKQKRDEAQIFFLNNLFDSADIDYTSKDIDLFRAKLNPQPGTHSFKVMNFLEYFDCIACRAAQKVNAQYNPKTSSLKDVRKAIEMNTMDHDAFSKVCSQALGSSRAFKYFKVLEEARKYYKQPDLFNKEHGKEVCDCINEGGAFASFIKNLVRPIFEPLFADDSVIVESQLSTFVVEVAPQVGAIAGMSLAKSLPWIGVAFAAVDVVIIGKHVASGLKRTYYLSKFDKKMVIGGDILAALENIEKIVHEELAVDGTKLASSIAALVSAAAASVVPGAQIAATVTGSVDAFIQGTSTILTLACEYAERERVRRLFNGGVMQASWSDIFVDCPILGCYMILYIPHGILLKGFMKHKVLINTSTNTDVVMDKHIKRFLKVKEVAEELINKASYRIVISPAAAHKVMMYVEHKQDIMYQESAAIHNKTTNISFNQLSAKKLK